jgi:hypothetical protein
VAGRGLFGQALLDGYILSIVGTALTGMKPQLDLNTTDIQLIGASTLVGMLVGGRALQRPSSGGTGDRVAPYRAGADSAGNFRSAR